MIQVGAPNQVSGSIYRITRKDRKQLTLPQIDFSTIHGLLQALKNPAVNVRSHAAYLLTKKGKEAVSPVQEFLEEVSGEPVPGSPCSMDTCSDRRQPIGRKVSCE
jgi:hypothetical protein